MRCHFISNCKSLINQSVRRFLSKQVAVFMKCDITFLTALWTFVIVPADPIPFRLRHNESEFLSHVPYRVPRLQFRVCFISFLPPRLIAQATHGVDSTLTVYVTTIIFEAVRYSELFLTENKFQKRRLKLWRFWLVFERCPVRMPSGTPLSWPEFSWFSSDPVGNWRHCPSD